MLCNRLLTTITSNHFQKKELQARYDFAIGYDNRIIKLWFVFPWKLVCFNDIKRREGVTKLQKMTNEQNLRETKVREQFRKKKIIKQC